MASDAVKFINGIFKCQSTKSFSQDHFIFVYAGRVIEIYIPLTIVTDVIFL